MYGTHTAHSSAPMVNTISNGIDFNMATPITEWTNLEVRAVVRFLFAKGTKCSEIYREIVEIYGEHAMSKSRVYQWCSWFKDGRKRPGLLRSGLVLQHDNATPHTAKRTKEWLERYRGEILPHPAHSPDLAPSDFYLFGPLKRHLGDKQFKDEEELISEVCE